MAQTNLVAETSHVSFERERGVYAIDVTRDVAHAVISAGDEADRSQRFAQVFHTLAEAGIPIFLVKLHRTAVTLALAGEDVPRAEAALAAAEFRARIRRDLALLAVRAPSMRDLTGVMVQIADALYDAGARLYASGDSHNSVQCLIEADRADEAARKLCATFRLADGAICNYDLDGERVA